MIEQLGRHGARVKDLRRRIKHRREDEVIVDGRRLVDDLVRWEVPIRELYLTPELATELPDRRVAGGGLERLRARAIGPRRPRSDPQPAGSAGSGRSAAVAEVVGGAGCIALWLDRVQDPGNLGAYRALRRPGSGRRLSFCRQACADPFCARRGTRLGRFRIPPSRRA